MKVIISGGTGFIGGAVLQRLIALPEVTSIIALSRRELTVKDAKVHTVIVKDFLNYDEATLSQMKGAVACIWCLGTPQGGRDVHMDIPMAAAKACASNLDKEANTFRFVLTSGIAAVRETEKTLWFLGNMRRMRASRLASSDNQRKRSTNMTVAPGRSRDCDLEYGEATCSGVAVIRC